MNKLKKILILDDDEISTYLTKKIAEKSNLVEESQIFHLSEEALSNLRTAILNQTVLPDLIVLDINMPVLDGWDFVNELQKKTDVAYAVFYDKDNIVLAESVKGGVDIS